jgi:hypothetical protein
VSSWSAQPADDTRTDGIIDEPEGVARTQRGEPLLHLVTPYDAIPSRHDWKPVGDMPHAVDQKNTSQQAPLVDRRLGEKLQSVALTTAAGARDLLPRSGVLIQPETRHEAGVVGAPRVHNPLGEQRKKGVGPIGVLQIRESEQGPKSIDAGASQFAQPIGSVSAAAVVITIPIIVFVLLFQRRIVAGLTSGAVKG